MLVDLAHTAFAVQDVEATLAFYKKLGIEEAFRLHREDGSLMLVYCHIGGDRFLEFFPGGPSPDPARQQSFMHICLATDDIAADVEKIRAAGITIDKEIKEGLDKNLQAWITDPDGNKIELMQMSPESPQSRVAREASKL